MAASRIDVWQIYMGRAWIIVNIVPFMVLLGALFKSYIAQRYKNNTIFLISHATLNGIPLIMLLMNIIG